MARSTSLLARSRDAAPRRAAIVGTFAVVCGLSAPARAEDPPRTWPLVETRVRAPGLPLLERRAVGAPWEAACVPPCTRRLDPLLEYRIGGDGLVASDPFRLPLGAARVQVDARAGSPMLRDIGTLFIVGGVLFAAGGGAVLLLPPPSGASDDAKTDKTVVGVGFLTVGALVAGVGIALRLLSITTVDVGVAR